MAQRGAPSAIRPSAERDQEGSEALTEARAEAALPQVRKVERITGTSKKRSLLSVLTSSTRGLFFPTRNNARKVPVQVKIACSLYAGMLNEKKNSGYL